MLKLNRRHGYIQTKSQNNKAKVLIVISNKLDFRAKSIIRDHKNYNRGRSKNQKIV